MSGRSAPDADRRPDPTPPPPRGRRAEDRAAAHRNSRLRLGTRLAIGFAVVAGLFFVANRMTQQATWVAATHVARVEFQHEPLARSAQTLTAAVGRFERAVLERADAARPTATGAPERARTVLAQSLADYAQVDAAVEADVKRIAPDELSKRVLAWADEGAQLVERADARRAELRAYWAQFDALEARVSRSNGAKLALGDHVFVRRSSTELRESFSRVRDRYAAYLAAPDARHEAAVTDAERMVRETLSKHAAALSETEGGAWVTRLQGDFEANVTQRENSIRAERRYARDRQRFSARAARLTDTIDTEIAAPAREAMAGATRRVSEATKGADKTIAAATLAATLLILLIAVVTVYGVTGPVRRLTAATRRLASGERDVRVPRGGARELDELAESFNAMAVQLATAEQAVRGYQSELEARVDERTQQLQHLAHHDPLTELPNRRHLFAHLSRALEPQDGPVRRVGLLLLDLDNFKVVNDSLGHEFGDAVLQAVGERLRRAVAGSGFTARLGGDEFTVVCENVASVQAFARLADRIVAAFQHPVTVDGRELLLGVSAGASVAPDHAPDAESLLRAADSALFRAKELGRNRASVYSPELLEAAAARFQTEQGLRRAIDAGEFELVYQPQVALQTLEVESVEALIRWRRRDGSLMAPGAFLAVAEQSGLIVPIGDWVLQAAAAAALDWHRGAWPAARVAINVSPQQFLDGGFVARVERLLVETGLPPRCLEIELTESVLQTGTQTVDALRALQAFGVSIALDDFGTGFSSMTSLEKLPLSRVKIDRSLIADVDTNARSAAIARSIIRLCHDLSLEVTAEGVERSSQVEWLLGCGPVSVQGYWFAKPFAATEVVPFRALAAQRAAEVNRLVLEQPPGAEVIPMPTRRRSRRRE